MHDGVCYVLQVKKDYWLVAWRMLWRSLLDELLLMETAKNVRGLGQGGSDS